MATDVFLEEHPTNSFPSEVIASCCLAVSRKICLGNIEWSLDYIVKTEIIQLNNVCLELVDSLMQKLIETPKQMPFDLPVFENFQFLEPSDSLFVDLSLSEILGLSFLETEKGEEVNQSF